MINQPMKSDLFELFYFIELENNLFKSHHPKFTSQHLTLLSDFPPRFKFYQPIPANSIQKSKPAQQRKIQIKLFKQDQTTNFENKQIFAATFNLNPTLYSP